MCAVKSSSVSEKPENQKDIKSEKSRNDSKCSMCRNHHIDVLFKGHSKNCPFNNPFHLKMEKCYKCRLTNKRRKKFSAEISVYRKTNLAVLTTSDENQALPTASSGKTASKGKKRGKQYCRKCSFHLEKKLLINHKKDCPYLNCKCSGCFKVRQRCKAFNKEAKAKRKLKSKHFKQSNNVKNDHVDSNIILISINGINSAIKVQMPSNNVSSSNESLPKFTTAFGSLDKTFIVNEEQQAILESAALVNQEQQPISSYSEPAAFVNQEQQPISSYSEPAAFVNQEQQAISSYSQPVAFVNQEQQPNSSYSEPAAFVNQEQQPISRYSEPTAFVNQEQQAISSYSEPVAFVVQEQQLISSYSESTAFVNQEQQPNSSYSEPTAFVNQEQQSISSYSEPTAFVNQEQQPISSFSEPAAFDLQDLQNIIINSNFTAENISIDDFIGESNVPQSEQINLEDTNIFNCQSELYPFDLELLNPISDSSNILEGGKICNKTYTELNSIEFDTDINSAIKNFTDENVDAFDGFDAFLQSLKKY